MAIFEVLYKKEENKNLDVSNVNFIKHGFYFPYALPFVTLLIAIRRCCLFLAIWSFFIMIVYVMLGHSIFGMFLKITLLITFAFFAPDIKRFDLIKKGYISGGYFVEKNRIKVAKKFFKNIKP